MDFSLPKTVTVAGEKLEIRYDFRVILEIIVMLSDDNLSGPEKTAGIKDIFYLEPDRIKNTREAVEECYTFIGCGKKNDKQGPKITDWEQDFEYIIAPVNRVLGFEARAVEYDPLNNTGGVHWWTFMAAFMEIGGDCLYSQIVSIRDKQARRKKLEKYEREWLRRNGDLVRLRQQYTAEDEEILKQWT